MEMRPTIRNVAVVDWKFALHSSNFPRRADRFADAAAASARCRDKGDKGDVKRKYSRILITRFIRQAEYQARFCIPMNISSGISVPGYTTVYSLGQHRSYGQIKARCRSTRALKRAPLFETSTINHPASSFFTLRQY